MTLKSCNRLLFLFSSLYSIARGRSQSAFLAISYYCILSIVSTKINHSAVCIWLVIFENKISIRVTEIHIHE